MVTHFGHAVFHVLQWISVPGAASTNNLLWQRRKNIKQSLKTLAAFHTDSQVLMCLADYRLQTSISFFPDILFVKTEFSIPQYLRVNDLLFHSCGSGVCEQWGWNLQCSSCTSSLVRQEREWELFLPEKAKDDLWSARHAETISASSKQTAGSYTSYWTLLWCSSSKMFTYTNHSFECH